MGALGPSGAGADYVLTNLVALWVSVPHCTLGQCKLGTFKVGHAFWRPWERRALAGSSGGDYLGSPLGPHLYLVSLRANRWHNPEPQSGSRPPGFTPSFLAYEPDPC